MCSLSILRQHGITLVTMNRDEARDRHEAQYMHQVKNSSAAVYPIDLRSGGTWFGANRFGVGLALLNRYQDVYDAPNPISRGALIPALLEYSSILQMRLALKHTEQFSMQHYQPFDLVIFDNQSTYLCSWNGREASQQPKAGNFFISSSAVRTLEVIQVRQEHYQRWLQERGQTVDLDSHVLMELHLAEQADQSFAIRMARAHSHTKSVCQLRLDDKHQSLHYWNEANLLSCEAAAPFASAECYRWPKT
jgi:uncharacterized protein with NRDE domain